MDEFPDKKPVKANLLESYSSVVLSADHEFFYASNREEEEVYAYTVKENVQINERSVHAILHTISGIYPKGAIAMDVDVNDRLYVLTEIGLQCVRSFGLIDAILDLPQGKPLDICVRDSIYVKTNCGVYKRDLKQEYLNEKRRLFVSYYD